jgi:hypothetical protein
MEWKPNWAVGAEDCFSIEETALYNQLKGGKVRSVDVVLSYQNQKQLLFVEARSSLPSKENEDYIGQIEAISKKFMDSFHLTCGIWFGEHNSKVNTPKNRELFFVYGTKIIFVLIIKNRKGDLTGIKEIIRKYLKSERKLLGFEVLVLNENNAKENGLIT